MKTSRTLAVFFWIFAVFLLLPLLIIIPISFTDADFLRFPPTAFGVRWYVDYLTDPQWIDSTILSVRVATFASFFATVIGTLTALGIHQVRSGLKGPLLTYIGLPLVVPHIFVALGIFVITLRLGLLGSELVLIAAHATMGLPLVVLIVLAQVQQLDVAVERAARIHGASATRTFFSVTLPALRPSMIAGAIIAFFTSFDELTVALFIMSGQETLPMRLWANMKLDISPVIAPIATILIVVTTVCLLFAEFIRRRASEATK